MSEAMKLKAASLTTAELRENEALARLSADYWLGVLHERTAGDYTEASVEGIRLAYQNYRDSMKFVALHEKGK
jgi:hypothetical protein